MFRWLALHALPISLFGRLALLLFFVVVASHILALLALAKFHPGVFAGGPKPPAWKLLDAGMLADLGVRLAALLATAWLGARWLSEPIRHMAEAAREIGRDINSPPFVEEGTQEVREASRVFNRMQAHIQKQLSDRDRLIAAVSHDLRTPLTRLRLRAESLEDADEKFAFRQDIVEMDGMIRETLDYMLGAARIEPSQLVDIAALLHSMADDHADAGHAGVITVRGTAAPLGCQPLALRRALQHLIEESLRRIDRADICLSDSPQALTICVACGTKTPAVPGGVDRTAVFAGLGLSISEAIVKRHGGTFLLSRCEHGHFHAELQLPRQAA